MSSPLDTQLVSYARMHANDGIFLDTNVLLLWLVHKFDASFIGRERLKAYEQRDAIMLSNYVSCFKRILTTPHVLAETSNFARQMMKGRTQVAFFGWLHPLFCADGDLPAFSQTTASSREIKLHKFVRLGLTDSALAASVSTTRLLLTADLDLHVATVTQGGHSINFTHMREAAGYL